MNLEQNWWKNSVVYQIYPRSFCDSNGDGVGDLNGIRSKLWYLEQLGVDVLWLSPVYCSPNADNGYDISDYYNIQPEYGTMEDMKQLLDECNQRGMRVIMDLVVNHTSDEHTWFQQSRSSKTNPYRDFYIWRPGKDGGPPNDLSSNFGGSAWEYDPETQEYYLHFYGKKQPDLNWSNPRLRQEIWKMMNFWIDLGIGGFRMDVIDLIGKEPDRGIRENGPKLHEYLQEMNRETFGKHDLLTVGECWGATPDIGRLYSDPDRHELSMIFQFEQIQLDKQPGGHRWDLKPLELPDLKAVFTKWQKELDGHGWNSLFWSNHDLPRIVSRWGNDGAYRVESAKMLATVLHGMKGTPYIYQGEELGMTNMPFASPDDFTDIESRNICRERRAAGFSEEEILTSLRAKARDNARTPMQWSQEPQAGFTTGTPWFPVNPNYTHINAQQALDDPDSIFYYYQKLVALRKHAPILTQGSYELLCPQDPDVYAYLRRWQGETWLILCNFHQTTASFSYPGQGKAILSNYSQPELRDLTHVSLRPYEAAIYQIRESEESL